VQQRCCRGRCRLARWQICLLRSYPADPRLLREGPGGGHCLARRDREGVHGGNGVPVDGLYTLRAVPAELASQGVVRAITRLTRHGLAVAARAGGRQRADAFFKLLTALSAAASSRGAEGSEAEDEESET
jgi:hypothetical protein